MAVPVVLVPRPGLEHGPAHDVIGARRLFVDQELDLHVDPAVVAAQTLHRRNVAQVGAVHRGRWLAAWCVALLLAFDGARHLGGGVLHGFRQSGSDPFGGGAFLWRAGPLASVPAAPSALARRPA